MVGLLQLIRDLIEKPGVESDHPGEPTEPRFVFVRIDGSREDVAKVAETIEHIYNVTDRTGFRPHPIVETEGVETLTISKDGAEILNSALRSSDNRA